MKNKKTTLALKKLSKATATHLTSKQKIAEIKEFKSAHRLTTSNLVELLAIEDFHISRTSLASYFQGNVLGNDTRSWSSVNRDSKGVDHVSHLHAEIMKLELKYGVIYKKLLSASMRELMESWYRVLKLDGGSQNRQLSKILGIGHTTLFKWYRDDRYPQSIKTLLQITRQISTYVASQSTLTTRSI